MIYQFKNKVLQVYKKNNVKHIFSSNKVVRITRLKSNKFTFSKLIKIT